MVYLKLNSKKNYVFIRKYLVLYISKIFLYQEPLLLLDWMNRSKSWEFLIFVLSGPKFKHVFLYTIFIIDFVARLLL